MKMCHLQNHFFFNIFNKVLFKLNIIFSTSGTRCEHTCIKTVNGEQCTCPYDFTGPDCSIKINSCSSIRCGVN